MFKFWNELIQEQIVLVNKFELANSLINLLQYLNMKNDDTVWLALKTIVNTHKSVLIKEITLNQPVDIVLRQICQKFVTKAFRHAHTELCPVCSWMARKIGEIGVRQMISEAKPGKRYSTSSYSAVYCVAGLYNWIFETENVSQFPCLRDWFSLNFLCYWKNSRSRICSIRNVTPREYERISQSRLLVCLSRYLWS